MKNAEIKHEGFKANLFIDGIDMGEMEEGGNATMDDSGYSYFCFVKDKDGEVIFKVVWETTQAWDDAVSDYNEALANNEEPDPGILEEATNACDWDVFTVLDANANTVAVSESNQ